MTLTELIDQKALLLLKGPTERSNIIADKAPKSDKVKLPQQLLSHSCAIFTLCLDKDVRCGG